MAVIDAKVKLRVSTHFEFKIHARIFRVQTLKFHFKPKSVVWEESLKLKGTEGVQFSGVDKISCCLRLISKFMCS